MVQFSNGDGCHQRPAHRNAPTVPRTPALPGSRQPPRTSLPALPAAAALRAPSPARATIVSSSRLAPGPAHASAIAPRNWAARASHRRLAASSARSRLPQCAAAVRWDWSRADKARPPLARAAAGLKSRELARALAGCGGAGAVRVSRLWSGCGRLGQVAGATGRCGARGAPREQRALRPGEAAPFPSSSPPGRGRRPGLGAGRSARGGLGHADSRPLCSGGRARSPGVVDVGCCRPGNEAPRLVGPKPSPRLAFWRETCGQGHLSP